MKSIKNIQQRLGHSRPHLFFQTIVQSDGSTFTLSTSHPKTVSHLTKDTRNHPLWNPSLHVVDVIGQVSKFQSLYGDLGSSLNIPIAETSQDSSHPSDTPIIRKKKKK